MIKIRKHGERARIFFDDIDFSTLKIIYQNEGISVMSLVKKVKVKHNTWKQHFEKLKSFNLIYVEKEKQVKKIFLTENGKSLLVIFSQSLTSQTSPNGDFSKEKEHNISLKESSNEDSQISSNDETSLNNNIMRPFANAHK
jgi:predicted transcriptional regulator